MRNISLFDSLRDDEFKGTFTPSEPPLIASKGIKDICLNLETNGLRWFDTDRPIAASIRLPDGSLHYVSWGHSGGNIDEETARRWAQRELRDLHITNINTRFDVHHAYVWGVDLEAQNCTVSDVSHFAALLDDHRQRFSLDLLIQDILGETPMMRLDESRMAEYHAAEAAPRAMYNVQKVWELKERFWPQLVEEDLLRVVQLENNVIYPVCEMERNGAPIDVELLERWLKESQKKYEQCLYDLIKMTGFQVDPQKPEHRLRLFKHYGLPLEHLPSGRPSFTDAIMRGIDHPAVQLVRKATKIASLRSKYLVKYKNNVDSKGIIRYALHQLRAQKDLLSDYSEAGTVTGRFSSSEIIKGYGLNIQQEMKASKQRVAFGYDEKDASHDEEIYIIRMLRVPPKGRLWLSADARQIEYRIFVSYSGNQRALDAYRQNPLTDFHDYMLERLRPFKPDLRRKNTKDLNFAYVYGAGLIKQSVMLGHINAEEYNLLKSFSSLGENTTPWWKSTRPDVKTAAAKLEQTKEIRRIYAQELPEVADLLARASHIAKPHCDKNCDIEDQYHKTEEHRGFVRTVLGRRSRFPDGKRLHKAFNSIDQGSGADIMKQKLVELHANRKYTDLKMRYTVHDEVDGDAGPETAARVQEILDSQSFPELKVPILWEVSTGRNWSECG